MTKRQNDRFEAARVASAFDNIENQEADAVRRAASSADEKREKLKEKTAPHVWAAAMAMIEAGEAALTPEEDAADFEEDGAE